MDNTLSFYHFVFTFEWNTQNSWRMLKTFEDIPTISSNRCILRMSICKVASQVVKKEIVNSTSAVWKTSSGERLLWSRECMEHAGVIWSRFERATQHHRLQRPGIVVFPWFLDVMYPFFLQCWIDVILCGAVWRKSIRDIYCYFCFFHFHFSIFQHISTHGYNQTCGYWILLNILLYIHLCMNWQSSTFLNGPPLPQQCSNVTSLVLHLNTPWMIEIIWNNILNHSV